MRDRYRSVIGKSSIRHICTRMRMLALSACAYCAIAAALHLASIAAVVRRMRRSEADEAGGETLEGISIVRPVCDWRISAKKRCCRACASNIPAMRFCSAWRSRAIRVRRLMDVHTACSGATANRQ